MSSLYMPASAAIISVILLIVYCTKEKIEIKENNIYLLMLICILLDSVFISVIFTNYGRNPGLIKFLNRCDYMMLTTWSSSLCLYTHTVLYKKVEGKQRKQKFFLWAITILTAVEYIMIWSLRLEAVIEHGITTAIVGPAVYFTFGCCAVHLLLSLIVILCNLRKLNRQVVPVFIFLGIATLCAVVYYFDPSISGVSMGLAIVNLTMYFTIENPDVKMLEQVNMAKEQAQRANQAKTDFLSSMSHEIRTPINAIIGLAVCIQNDTTLDTAKEDAMDIGSASENLLEIINGILDISKIEAGRMEIVNREYDLVDMSSKLAKLIKSRIGEKPIELRTRFSDNIPGVLYGDGTKLRQIMTNLLTNAVKYTETGHIDFTIDCINTGNTANLTMTVTDTGQGIKADAIDSLFDKFKRLEEDKNSNIEGTGLGLAITKQLVEMFGGKIEVHSIYGTGTTFIVRVSQEIRSLERRLNEIRVEAKKEYPGRKVLVVDDIALNLVVARRLLELYKIDADTAASGEECIEKCRSNNYDLILLDEMMPKMSGLETLTKLREDPSFTTPVVACTADALEGMREKYLNDGYSGYLSKPIVMPELMQVLERFLGRE